MIIEMKGIDNNNIFSNLNIINVINKLKKIHIKAFINLF